MDTESLPASLEDVRLIIARLHEPAPDGCPWCLDQTPRSLAEELVKEAHEALAAASSDDSRGLSEELGDVLLLILTQTHLGEVSGSFTMDSMLEELRAKVVRRHPHIFADAIATTPAEAVQQWQSIKRQEDGAPESVLDGIPRSLPSLLRADEIQRRAAQIGFDWPDMTGVVAKVHEEVDELVAAKPGPEQLEEIGDLFFALVNLARKMGLSSEQALQEANEKFTRRFTSIEAACRAQGVAPETMTLEALDDLWNAAKAEEKARRDDQ